MRTLVLLADGHFKDEEGWYSLRDCPRPEFVAIAQKLDGNITSLKQAEARLGPLYGRLFARAPLLGSAIAAVLRRRDHDCFYCVTEELGLISAPMLQALGWKGKVIAVVHAMSPKKKLLLDLFGHSRIGRFIVLSALQRDRLVKECGIPAEKVTLLPYWLDTDFFRPAPKDAAPSAPPYIFACGKEDRDYDTLVAAAREADIKVVILGHGYFGDHTTTTAASPPNVEFRSRKPFPELVETYQGAEFVVLPLKMSQHAAGLTAMLEAMACGKYVIVSASKGLMSYFDDHSPGEVVPVGDPSAMADAIHRALADPERCRRTGDANREHVVRTSSLDVYTRHVERIIAEELCGTAPATGAHMSTGTDSGRMAS